VVVPIGVGSARPRNDPDVHVATSIEADRVSISGGGVQSLYNAPIEQMNYPLKKVRQVLVARDFVPALQKKQRERSLYAVDTQASRAMD
jgi:hypothetical protein